MTLATCSSTDQTSSTGTPARRKAQRPANLRPCIEGHPEGPTDPYLELLNHVDSRHPKASPPARRQKAAKEPAKRTERPAVETGKPVKSAPASQKIVDREAEFNNLLLAHHDRAQRQSEWKHRQHVKAWDPDRIRRALARAARDAAKPRRPSRAFGLSRAFCNILTRARHVYEALGLEILTDLRMTDIPLTRDQIIAGLSKYVGDRLARVLFEHMTGRGKDRSKKKRTPAQQRERELYQKHLQRITTIRGGAGFLTQTDAALTTVKSTGNKRNSIKTTSIKNSNTNRFVSEIPQGWTESVGGHKPDASREGSHPVSEGSQRATPNANTRKAGRPPKVYCIRGEQWRVQEMLDQGEISADTVEVDPSEFEEGHLKLKSDLTSTRAFMDMLIAYRVDKGGEGKYSRGELADPSGLSRSSVSVRARRRGITVQPSPPRLTELDEQQLRQIPFSRAEYRRMVQEHMLCRGTFLQDETDKRYPYRQQEARRLLDEGHLVFVGTFEKSTYIPASTYDGEAERGSAESTTSAATPQSATEIPQRNHGEGASPLVARMQSVQRSGPPPAPGTVAFEGSSRNGGCHGTETRSR